MPTGSKPRRTPRVGAALAVVLGGFVAAISSGCPDNFCFLKVCNGRGECSCPVSSCSDGAGFDTTQNRCRCLAGFFEVAGHCLDQNHANAYCGRGYGWANTGCVKLTCKPGDSLDSTTGMCVPKDQVAAQAGVQVGQGQTIGCTQGNVLVVDNGKSACVPAAQSCAKDETWNGQACQKTASCPTGSAWDAARGQCVPFSQSGSSGAAVDVVTWAQTNYGANGGPGSPSFCSTFATKPWSFGISDGQTAVIRVAISLSFPGQDVAKGQLSTQAVYDYSGGAVPPQGTAAVQSGAQSSFGALVAGGGKANQTQVQTTVKCPVVNASKPQVVPATGGA